MKKGKKLLLMLFFLVSLMALCSCKGNTTQKKEATQATKTPTYGGSVIVGITQDLDSLDPHKAVAAGTKEVLYNIFEGLVKPDESGKIIPAVASSYEMLDHGSRYLFTLREGVKFHDGSLVTAEDVIYSIKRCAGLLDESDPEVVVESALLSISSIEEIKTEDNKAAVQIILSQPNTELLAYLTCSIIPCDYNDQKSHPIGTGPFQFVSYAPLQNLIMKKNKEYYGNGIPYLDEVTFKISANTDAAFLELMAGAIDIFPYLTEEQAIQLSNQYQIAVGNMNLVQALFLNNKAKPFDDILVRQALCYAIDRQFIIDMVGGGDGTVIGSNMFPGFTSYYDEGLAEYYTYSPEKAKELLKKAGYPDGFTFTIQVPSNYQIHVDTAQVIVEQLKEVGITAKIQLIEWASWLADVYKDRNYEATVIGLDANLAPSDLLKRYESTASNNFVNYSNASFDEMFSKAVTEADEQEKRKDYQKLQERLTKDAAAVYLQDPSLKVAVNKKLSGYKFYPVYVQDMSSVYYVAEE